MARQRACDLPLDVNDPLAEQLLAACEEDPRCEASRMALADRLDDLGPTRVGGPACPNWMRKAWLGSRIYNSRDFGTSASDVLQMLDHWFDWPWAYETYGDKLNIFDHDGSCRILGRLCYVTEPYQWHRDVLLCAMKRIAQVVGGTPLVCGNSAHGFDRWEETHLLRGLIIPEAGRR